jgi:hypothetical protein
MNRDDELKVEAAIKENMEKIRFDGLAAGAKGVSGAVLEICNDKAIKNDTVRITRLEIFVLLDLD